ncbi:MAG: SUMF1/EgtB/PvdO family nonheme iron enzyme, partial [Bacteroidota bacterium]
LGDLEKVSPRPKYGTFSGHNGGGFVFILKDMEILGSGPGRIRNKRPTNQLVQITAEPFELGSSKAFAEPDEVPVEVELGDFFLADHEVTALEFKEFIKASGYVTTADKAKFSLSWDGEQYVKCPRVNWAFNSKNSKRTQAEMNHPVVHVSWYDAIAYCNWRSGQENLEEVYKIKGEIVEMIPGANGYRLPTEAEWEFAASEGPKDKIWAGTNQEKNLYQYANFCDRKCGLSWKNPSQTDGFIYTAPVKSFKPNDFGLYDLSGNVAEWCWDGYRAYSDYGSPIIKNNYKANGEGARVIRGGSWDDEAKVVRTADRTAARPNHRDRSIGFRVARNME